MGQQMLKGSYYDGSVTVTNRMSGRYAVINPPECGKHRKAEKQRKRRHFQNVLMRNLKKHKLMTLELMKAPRD